MAATGGGLMASTGGGLMASTGGGLVVGGGQRGGQHWFGWAMETHGEWRKKIREGIGGKK
jgi:hypothetical protein